ncbi:fosfomycin resistance glutathione transferase [Chimaeribacter californicus]|uniref:Fosfomycin resistance glutathione transferase n=1 Tax=Chimaeribacter californicus TaxID=2060067 RepID=A0A2N5DWD1_9GAMM|nr:fosfomycin resistance glutathione transferase [Chimaeribacter californicus]PLR31488.1 fosfomycin resistance glutathione transferase [Chimaeribacter californicus]
MLQGLNHLTLAVSDITASLNFYQGLLGMEVQACWESGAYLSCGPLWLCLSVDAARCPAAPENSDYTHYAFTIAQQDFTPFTERLRLAGVAIWKENRSEGDSFYFLDPDGHKLEIHVGSLAQRLAACRQSPYAGMVFKEA